MQVDSETAMVVASGIGVFSSVAGGLISYGILNEKVNTLEKRAAECEAKTEKILSESVTFRHFDSIIFPLQEMMIEVQRDIKKLLSMIRHNNLEMDN